jgi:hypothetical protein
MASLESFCRRGGFCLVAEKLVWWIIGGNPEAILRALSNPTLPAEGLFLLGRR